MKKAGLFFKSSTKILIVKLIITVASLLYFSTSFSQWTRVEQLPATNIASLYHKDNILYAGGKNIIYISQNDGLTWDSTSAIPQFILVTSIIVYKNELYAAAPHKGVFKSADGGTTWQNISAGIFPDVSGFCEFKGDLYAATLGSSVYKLDPVSRNNWLSFRNGLSNLSANITALGGNNNALIAGTNANGLYGHLPANSTTWEERFLLNQISPNEGAYDIVASHDTLFYAGKTGKFYMSADNGLNWNLFGNRLVTGATFIVNAKQALISSRYIFDGVSSTTLFYYIKKDSLQHPFRNFSVVTNHFTWKIDILGDKLWDASDRGLFFMSLSDLPGISAADDTVSPTPLPVRFISFNANCQKNEVLITWKTTQEQNSNHYNIERSLDSIHWTVIGDLPATGNSNTEKSYSFTDNNPGQNGFYRIAEYDMNGKAQYSSVLRSSCTATNVFSLWPNPVNDNVFINIVTGSQSQAVIKLFDSKGAFVKEKRASLLQGSNLVSIDMKLLANGVYHLSVTWNNGQMQKAAQVVKQ